MIAVCIAALAATFGALLMAFLLQTSGTIARWLGARHAHTAEHELADLFIFVSPRGLSAFCVAVAAAGVLLVLVNGAPPLLAVPVGLLALLSPRWGVASLRRRRTQRVLQQLPDALTLLAGLLRSGHGLTQGLALLALRQSAPLQQELQLMLRKHRLGLPLDAAIAQLHQRIPEPDVALLAMAIRCSRELGGNLAESLQRLADGLRGRLVLQGKIHALTSQGRLQGVIVGLLPIGLMVVLTWMDPAPMKLLWVTPSGWAALALIAVLEGVGFYLIRRIVSIDV
jgi:tight adherence protein B